MGKARTDRYSQTREQKLVRENKELRREITKLRKILAKFENFENVKEILEENQLDNKEETQKLLDDIKKAWNCHECETGYLEIILFNKLTETWYFRRCNNCNNRTKSKKYDPKEVNGILKE